MADKKISELDAATIPLAGTETVPLVQSSSTRRAALSDLPVSNAVQTALNDKADLDAPTFTGTVTLEGDLTVNGTTTTINSTTLTIDDKNIVLAEGAADGASADGAGISIDGAAASLVYNNANSQFQFDIAVAVEGGVLPLSDASYDLGSSAQRWRELYLSGSSIDFAGTEISTDTQGNLFLDTSKQVVVSDTTGITGASKIENIVTLSQADYDAIAAPDPNTLYVIQE